MHSLVGLGNVIALPVELLKEAPSEFAETLGTLFDMSPALVLEKLSFRENVTGQRLSDYRFGSYLESVIRHPFATRFKSFGLSRKDLINWSLPVMSFFGLRQSYELNQTSISDLESLFSPHNLALDQLVAADLKELGYYNSSSDR